VRFIEMEGKPYELQAKADELVGKHGCAYLGFINADASYFPPSYSVHENEIHAALRNRAAKVNANLVIANFYQRPAQGIALKCDERVFAPRP
jgi:hypothetical protein